jgi:hypothetical protein
MGVIAGAAEGFDESHRDEYADDAPLTASFGGTSACAGDTEKSVMERAEKAFAESMAAGGNRFRSFWCPYAASPFIRRALLG